jgi:hypothetical protein
MSIPTACFVAHADRLAASKIGRFLRFGIATNPKVCGVGEGRKAAAKP